MVELAQIYDINDPLSEGSAYAKKVRESSESWDVELKSQMQKAQDL